jgi:tetratricopeptide (TPR) repeat protein
VRIRTVQARTERLAALSGLPGRQSLPALGCVLAGLFLAHSALAQLPETGYVSPPNPVNEYLDAIDGIEGDFGPYATELSDLYLGLGQTLLNSGDYEQARDAFHRGVLVVRVNSGPNSPEQSNHLYLIANIEVLLGNDKAADEVLENIQFINSDHYGKNSPEMLAVLDRMYQWYFTTRPPGSDHSQYADYERVIELTEDMVKVTEALHGSGHPETTEAYRRLGEAQFQAVRYLMGQTMTLSLDDYVAVSSGTLYTPGVVKVSVGEHYDAGRKAFKSYFESMLADKTTTPLHYAEALANMGDWYLVFEKSRTSRNLYEQAYQVLADSDDYAELAENYMAQPQPVHFFAPQPSLLEDVPMELNERRVDVSMTITSYGDVRYVEVLNPPEGLTDNHLGQIKREVRQTPFRPALKEGEVVTTKEFIWHYAIAAQGQAS